MIPVFIGIGSNVNREENIRTGVKSLRLLFGELLISPVYESKAYGFEGDNFYNLVIGIHTDSSPQMLLESMHEIENNHGRVRNLPTLLSRTLDLDLLIYGDLVCHTDELDIPRADIVDYSFILGPLADIAAEFAHPESGELISDIWQAFEKDDQEIWELDFSVDE